MPGGGAGGNQSFVWQTDLRTGSKSAKSPRVQTQYPQDGQISYTNPGQTTFKLSDSKHIREYVQKMIGKFNPTSGPIAQQLFKQGQQIIQSTATGNPVTDVIKQQDQTFKTEAQGNSNVLQMLTKLRQELNTSSMGGFPGQANLGSLSTIQGLLGGQLMGIFSQMAQLAQQTGQNQNNNQNSNKQVSTVQAVDANGNIISIT